MATGPHAPAAAVAAGITVRDAAERDLGNATPVAPLPDPLQQAAAAAIGHASEGGRDELATGIFGERRGERYGPPRS